MCHISSEPLPALEELACLQTLLHGDARPAAPGPNPPTLATRFGVGVDGTEPRSSGDFPQTSTPTEQADRSTTGACSRT